MLIAEQDLSVGTKCGAGISPLAIEGSDPTHT